MLAFSDSSEDGRCTADICDWTVRSYETGLSFLPVDMNWDQTGTVDLKMFSQDVHTQDVLFFYLLSGSRGKNGQAEVTVGR